MIELNILKINTVGRKLSGVKAFYRKANACVRVDGELSENFPIGIEVRQKCLMSPYLFSIFIDECLGEMKAKVGFLVHD